MEPLICKPQEQPCRTGSYGRGKRERWGRGREEKEITARFVRWSIKKKREKFEY